jgi:hypothetical protein
MKTYKFKVEVAEVNNGKSSLLDSFINEAKDEQRQLDITHKINRKTTEVHRQILMDFVTEVNEELSSIGFNEFKTSSVIINNNQYSKSVYRLKETSYSVWYNLEIIGVQGEFKDSKYTTFTGKYHIRLLSGKGHDVRVKTVDDVLTNLKGEIIEHIKKNREIVAS